MFAIKCGGKERYVRILYNLIYEECGRKNEMKGRTENERERERGGRERGREGEKERMIK